VPAVIRETLSGRQKEQAPVDVFNRFIRERVERHMQGGHRRRRVAMPTTHSDFSRSAV
jgi:hypothetical protein